MSEQIVCARCCMDRSASEVIFYADGTCNFCRQAEKSLMEIEREKKNLSSMVFRIKQDGKGKKYNCLIGLSGGLDSSNTLHEAVKLGLRPLCVSVDNGWQSDIAQENVMKLVEGLKVPFYRYVLNRENFRDLQSAFLKAGVPNVEIPTDHCLMAATLEMAKLYGIKWIISGGNVISESVMPPSWGYQPRDLRHIKSVYRWATGKRLSGLPLCGIFRWNIYKWWHGIRTFYLLDYLDYNRQKAAEVLAFEYGWEDYGGKHEESVFTAWFQNFYLFEKFGFDKRKAHFSSLIVSGQMTRAEAMAKLAENPVYPRLGIEEKAMSYPKRSHYEFPTDEWLWNAISKTIRFFQWRF